MEEHLTSLVDQNYAIRIAVDNAVDALQKEIYDWPFERTRGEYAALCDGILHITLLLEHPEGIEPR